MSLAAQLALGISAFGSIYMLLALAAVARFVREGGAAAARPEVAPSVTILKPLHGDEARLLECLASFCVQDYPGALRIVCGVKNRADPAVALVERLIERFPGKTIDLVIDPTPHGSNGKVANLVNMSRQLDTEVVIVSDSDIRVGPDYLSCIVGELARPGVGAVTCLYHGEPALDGLWAHLSALAINGHFIANVIVGVSLGLARPCFGSTIALRRETLVRIGGFAAFANDLADDYVIGLAVREAGYSVAIPSITVAHTARERAASELWEHELRWARTIRVLNPIGFFGTILSYPIPFALLGVMLAGFEPLSLWIAAAAFISRMVHCAGVARLFRFRLQPLWLVPVRDLLSFACFLWSFVRGGISWRGQDYQVLPDGTLVPARRPAAS